MSYLLEGNNGGIGEEVAWDSEKKMLLSVPFSYIFDEFKKVFFSIFIPNNDHLTIFKFNIYLTFD